MALFPSFSATFRMESAARPSVSATSMAASTMAATVSPGLGPRLGVEPAPHSSSMERLGLPRPAYSVMDVVTPYGVRYSPTTPYSVERNEATWMGTSGTGMGPDGPAVMAEGLVKRYGDKA